MDILEVRKEAREKMKGFCALCPECNGVWCAGKVPGMGGTVTGESFKYTARELKNIKVIMRTIHGVTEPNTEVKLFGETLSFPVIGAPITGAKFNMGGSITDAEYCDDVVKGAISAGTISMIGDTGDPTAYVAGLKAIQEVKGKGIAIIKPRANKDVIERIRMAEEAGALAVGIDIDGAGLITMKLFGQPVSPKTFEEIKELVESTKLPFIVKGILSVDEAELCVKAGVAAIIVSNHGGRVLNETLAATDVLEEIVASVGDKLTVLVDGGVREGVDVIKYIALGAKGVLLGRPMIWGSVGGRQEGVTTVLNNLKTQLIQGMILTGNQEIASINHRTIRRINK